MFKRFGKFLLALFIAFSLGYVISGFTYSRADISGHSMDYTLRDGQSIWVNRLPWNEYHRGDIVVLEADGTRIVKRVVAIGGDSIHFKGDDLYVNGKKVVEPYVTDSDYNKGVLAQDTKLEEDEFVVLGDNRDVSNDSRYFGPVRKSSLIGKVVGYEAQTR